jgi:hypothetical protein
MDRSLPIYASTASRRERGRGWSRRRRRSLRRAWLGAAGIVTVLVVLLALGAERLG